jgi:hypothetical protein
MGISEAKLGGASDAELRGLMLMSGVACAVGTPAGIGPLKDARRGGPDDSVERADRICDVVASFDPAITIG